MWKATGNVGRWIFDWKRTCILYVSDMGETIISPDYLVWIIYLFDLCIICLKHWKFILSGFFLLGVTAPTHTGQFHLTLAYHFDEDKQKVLESLVNNISLDSPVGWELQLYSRDKRTASAKQVYIKNSFDL